jgi:uncharacterized OB-fold protein
VLGYVDLPPGVRVLTQIAEANPDRLKVDMDVYLVERPMGQTAEGQELVGYMFRPMSE